MKKGNFASLAKPSNTFASLRRPDAYLRGTPRSIRIGTP